MNKSYTLTSMKLGSVVRKKDFRNAALTRFVTVFLKSSKPQCPNDYNGAHNFFLNGSCKD